MRALLFALALTACVGSPEARVRTALDTFGSVVDPAYEAAMAACVAQERPVMEAARTGELTPAEARERLDAIMGPCVRIGAAFDRIRALHDSAAGLVESGKFAQAETALIELKHAWDALREVNR